MYKTLMNEANAAADLSKAAARLSVAAARLAAKREAEAVRYKPTDDSLPAPEPVTEILEKLSENLKAIKCRCLEKRDAAAAAVKVLASNALRKGAEAAQNLADRVEELHDSAMKTVEEAEESVARNVDSAKRHAENVTLEAADKSVAAMDVAIDKLNEAIEPDGSHKHTPKKK